MAEIAPQFLFRGWFKEAEVAAGNSCFKAIDGSIFSADGKTLVRAKFSPEGFRVPDGTEVICTGALRDVHKTVYIPASVTAINDPNSPGMHITVLDAPEGSYAREYGDLHWFPEKCNS